MATYTTNLNLKKPSQSDKIRISDLNGNADNIDAAFGAIGTASVATQFGSVESGIAIVSVGNVHAAISAGQYVYVKGHDTLSEGLYTANSALAANATLSNSNLTDVSGGGLNALNSNINRQRYTKEYSTSSVTLAGIQSDAEILAGNDAGIFNVGYLNGTAASAIGISGASFVYMIKHNSQRICLNFIDITTGKRSYCSKITNWSDTIISID